MKKLIIVAITLLALNSCGQPAVNLKEDIVIESTLGVFPYGTIDQLKVIVIDNCEYIVTNSLRVKDPVMTHKGNCKFCKERNTHICNNPCK
jgi:hypothetical protein